MQCYILLNFVHHYYFNNDFFVLQIFLYISSIYILKFEYMYLDIEKVYSFFNFSLSTAFWLYYYRCFVVSLRMITKDYKVY